ncbi:MAG: gliding motility-associated C-terminal domain-containing protein [Lewinellaceae bacterium]|nr:gliding motility-associated C-terminal domain-containing protein [Phaeodactylibacter sp.]MCB9039458.1 gliding motility-associated C-terminal domain-containing protein [Lewinellaceae bacterium]
MKFFFLLLIISASLWLGLMPPAPPEKANAEICDNALDDDGDGRIDLNDPDCDCPKAAPISLIPNPSFEEQDCCPFNRSQMNCAKTWIQASAPTTDYLHACGWMGWPDLPPPLPFPDGEACLGFRNGRPGGNGGGPQPNWKEYAGACLTGPLKEGVAYRFEFYVGFTHPDNSPPTDIVFFGTTDCRNLPFGSGNSNFGCPTNGPGWRQLGSVPINGANQWQLKEINVVPREDIYAIAIGPGCIETPMNISTYYFFDKLVLAEEREFGFEISAQGHSCSEDFGLSLPFRDTLQYQWYRNGVALPGETGNRLERITEEGDYEVRLLGPNSCRVTSPYRHRRPAAANQIRRVICQGDSFSFGGQALAEGGVYADTLKTVANCDSIVRLNLEVIGQEADTVYAKIFEGESWPLGNRAYSAPGRYNATLLSSYGCDSLVHLILDIYKVYIPNAFSPNDDGRNDRFAIFAGQDIKAVLGLQVFNRWGGLVFESETLEPNASGNGWDGRIKGREAPPGLYVYQATVVTEDEKEHRLSGEVVLVR